jgi:threonine/homoserine/homoserine lactone efflux protein
VTLTIGLGFSASIQQFPAVSGIIKVLGSLYVLWIAWKMLSAGVLQDSTDAKPANFWDGCVLLLLNPKAYILITLIFTQFLVGRGR